MLRYERLPVGDYHDDNWLFVEVQVNAGALTGGFQAAFLTEEPASFLEELRIRHSTLRGKANFTTMEEKLSLELEGDDLGHISLLGKASDPLRAAKHNPRYVVVSPCRTGCTVCGFTPRLDRKPTVCWVVLAALRKD
ncbi:WapI family immunity protein [Paracidovorax avenae]|uniref:WapI family immunity protein n=1 Tax=Paracidovorax avenae TaxID=80867 RepID=UPI003F5388CE